MRTSEITISRSIADDVLFSFYKKDNQFADHVNKQLDNWGYSDGATDEDIKRKLFCLPASQVKQLLLKIYQL